MASQKLIRNETIEYIARHIASMMSGEVLKRKLLSVGVAPEIIVYPNTKWRMVFDVIDYYCKEKTPYALEMLGNIFEIALHPVSFNFLGEDAEKTAKIVLDDFNNQLKWDSVTILQEKNRFVVYTDIITTPDNKRAPTAHEIIIETLASFKKAYQQRYSINGFTYEYFLIELYAPIEEIERYDEEYRERRTALNNLIGSGVIIECTETVLSNEHGNFLYAECKLNEDKLMGRVIPSIFETKSDTLKVEIVNTNSIPIVTQQQVVDKKTPMKFPRKIPAGTKWENIAICFIDENNVEIRVAGFVETQGYASMGMSDNRDGSPNEQWQLLKVLANCAGIITASMPEARDEYKKQKQLLSDILKNYFSTDIAPFHTYSKKQGYRTKFTVFVKKDAPIISYSPKPDPMDGYTEMLGSH